jgi:putative hemolysin
MMDSRFLRLGLAFLPFLALPALAADGAPAGHIAGGGNPAAVYCRALGYEVEIVKTEDGERCICFLPNGEQCNAWDFFRGRVWPEYSYCARHGYRTVTRVLDGGSFTKECAVCVDALGREVGTVAGLMNLYRTALPEVTPGVLGQARRPTTSYSPTTRDLPPALNWCSLGGCTSVKNQGACGSCWAFGTVGPLESAILLKDGIEVDLSEQWLINCNRDGNGCSGGWLGHDYYQWKPDQCGRWGGVLEEDCPYRAADRPCNCPYPRHYWIDQWGYVYGYDEVPPTDLIKQALLDWGPLSTGVYVDSAWAAYTGGVFDECSTYEHLNHALTLVGWNDSLGTEGAWLLKNSWGPDWGEDGYMWTEYDCNVVGLGTAWVGPVNPLEIDLPGGPPDVLALGEATTVTVRIDETTESYVPGSGMLHYRYDGGMYQAVPLVSVGGDLYEADLPAPECEDLPEFYVSADGVHSGTLYHPPDAPETVHTPLVGTLTPVFEDDFESDLGWTVDSDPGLLGGAWERGVPVGDGSEGDPPSDFDGSGQCYVTENQPGNSNVDRGATRLISPPIDATAGDARVYYAVWYTNYFSSNEFSETFWVRISNDDGLTWTDVDSIGTDASFGWEKRSFAVADHVVPTDQVRVQFEASDPMFPCHVEAGLDAFSVRLHECGETDVAGNRTLASALNLRANVPNPFNPSTVIEYELPRTTSVRLSVYDVSGREVRVLAASDRVAPGIHRVEWNGRDESDRPVVSGVYFCRLAAGDRVLTQKMILAK